jgi:pimeloyl-ACP methyl ester carboxylesterase
VPEAAGFYYQHHSGGDPQGKHPPLVFIHGAGGSHLHWPPELRRMADHDVYSLDLPGHGRSGGDPERSVRGYAYRVIAWLDQLDLQDVVLVGHSMGGAISMTIVLEAPQHVLGLVLVGSGARLRVHPKILELTEDENLFRQAAALVTQWAFSDDADVRLVELANRRMAEVPAEVVHADFLACDGFDIMDRLVDISTPTLVICGEADQMTPVKYSQYLDQHIPDSRLVLIGGAGHMVMLEKPLEIVENIRGFLQRLG